MAKLKYLYKDKLPNGEPRWRLRWSGHSVDVDPGSLTFGQIYSTFTAAVVSAKQGNPWPLEPKKAEPKKIEPAKTFGYCLRQAYKANPFILWKPDRQSNVRYCLDDCAEELVNSEKPQLGNYADVAIKKITLHALEILVERKLPNLPGAARNRRRHLKWLFKWLKRRGFIDDNVALDLEKVDIPEEKQRRHVWTDGEIAAYRDHWPIGSKARLAFELHYHGLARADVVRVGPANVKVREGVKLLQGRRKKTGEHYSVPMSPMLLECIESTPPTRKDMAGKEIRVVGAKTFLVSEKGRLTYDERHYTQNVFKGWCKAAGLPPRCTTHGIRRARTGHRAQDGLTSEELNAENGWAPGSREPATYLAGVDTERLSLNAAKKGKV